MISMWIMVLLGIVVGATIMVAGFSSEKMSILVVGVLGFLLAQVALITGVYLSGATGVLFGVIGIGFISVGTLGMIANHPTPESMKSGMGIVAVMLAGMVYVSAFVLLY